MKRYSIITNDLEHCIECGRPIIELHEVFFGGRNRNKSIEDGLVIPLCKQFHHRGNLVGIHKDKELNLKYKKIAEQKWLEYYNKTIDDFISRYGRNYL
jgi:hypothetical protein